jgi:putative endonuclease
MNPAAPVTTTIDVIALADLIYDHHVTFSLHISPACSPNRVNARRLNSPVPSSPTGKNGVKTSLSIAWSQSFERAMYFVYIIETEDGTYYTGMTNDLARRFSEHVSNGPRSASYLRMHKPVYVVYTSECRSRGDAIRLETRLKSDYKFKMTCIGPRRSILEVIESELSYK